VKLPSGFRALDAGNEENAAANDNFSQILIRYVAFGGTLVNFLLISFALIIYFCFI
jgi:large-conductance mechanosensitive channel